MHSETLFAFQDELEKIAEEAQQKPSWKRRALKGVAAGTALVGGGMALKHYGPIALKKGSDHVKKVISEGVEEGLKKGSKGMVWNALSKRASLGDYKDMLMKALRNPETMKKLHPQEQTDALQHGLAQVFLKSPSLPSASRITTQTMFPAIKR